MTEPAKPKPIRLREAARKETEAALKALTKVMKEGSSEHARIAAASAILDRGHGKVGQPGKSGGDVAAGSIMFRWAERASEATPDPAQPAVCTSREPPQT